MKRKFLEDLGLEKEAIDKIMAENGTDINTAKGELDSVKEQLEAAQETITERDTQLQTLSTNTGDIEALKQQITQLQTDNKNKDVEYQTQLKEVQLTNAIKLAISDKAQDSDLVAGLFDRSKLIMNEDGKITGLDEQLESLKESKSFLFKEETDNTQNKPPFMKIGGNPPTGNTGADGTINLKDAISAYYQQQ